MIVLIILLALFVLILIMPVKVQIIKERDRHDVNVYFVKFFNKKVDLDEILNILTKDEENHYSLEKIIYNIKLFILGKNINRTLLKMVYVDKITAIISTDNIYKYVLYNNTIYYMREVISEYTKEVNSEYYSIRFNNEKVACFELVFYVRAVYILFSFIANIKDIIKVRKFIKYRRKQLGTLNK